MLVYHLNMRINKLYSYAHFIYYTLMYTILKHASNAIFIILVTVFILYVCVIVDGDDYEWQLKYWNLES